MGVLSQSRDQGAGAVTAPLQAPVDSTGFFSNVEAGFTAAKAGPHSTRVGQAIYETRAYDRIVQALNAEGETGIDYVQSPVSKSSPFYHPVAGERVNANGVVYVPVKRPFRNPYADAKNPIQGLYLGGDEDEKQSMFAAIARVRQRKPDFLKDLPDEAAITAFATAQRQKDLAASQAITERAGTLGKVGGFIGGMAGSIASGDPENLVGGGFGTAAGKTVARTVIKRAVEGAGVNAAAALVGVPGQVADAHSLGQEMTPEDIAGQVKEAAGIGAVFGTAHVVIPHTAAKVGQAVGAVADKVTSIPPVRDAIIAASIRAGTVKDHAIVNDWAHTHQPGGPLDTSTSEERAAAHVIIRDAATRETSPLEPEHAPANDHRLDRLAASLGMDLGAAKVPTTAPLQTPTVRVRGGRKPTDYASAINAAEGSTRNPRSSADGYGNFIDSTWLAIAPRVADTSGMSRAQILALRHDKGVASRATELYGADNARYLHARGIEDSPGNRSLAHFLGPEGAASVLKADPSTPVERLLPAKVVEANREVLRGKSASEVVAWAHKRIGAAVDEPVARADAVPEADPLDEADYSEVPYERATFTPDQLETDAGLMQYKSGGDENGITGKLRDVTQWDPIMSSEVLAWEGLDGRRVVVDGHQRVGLARRLSEQGQSIELPSLVVREADGITAAQARVLGALRNINLGTGSLIDNARVLRDVPHAAEILKGAENRREIEGLSKLSHEAFGAAINDVVDPRIAAEVGKFAPDPTTHMPLIAMLAKERISNPREAATIVRQAVADGFGVKAEHQLGMFGADAQQSLYVPIARILDASGKKLREEKRTFKALNEKAGRIEAAGNVLDRTANEGKVVGSDEALAILNATAHSAGPVRDALIAAARAELSGARRGDAVNQFLDALSGIDLRAAAEGASEHGLAGEPSRETGSRDADASADVLLASGNGSGLYDHAVAARQAAEPFSDPVGDAAKGQADIINHDLKMDAEAPAHLFDLPETGFRLSDEGEAQPLAQIMDEAEADEAAAQALRECLK